MDSLEGIITKTGMFYPTGFITALVMPPNSPDVLGQQLRDAGIADVRMFTSKEILADVERSESKQSFFDRIANSLSEEGILRDRYMDNIKLGGAMIMARMHSDAEAKEAHTILKTGGGLGIAHYSAGTIHQML